MFFISSSKLSAHTSLIRNLQSSLESELEELEEEVIFFLKRSERERL
jgi:hypothetical protein